MQNNAQNPKLKFKPSPKLLYMHKVLHLAIILVVKYCLLSNSMKHKPTRILSYINQIGLSCAINKLLFSWAVALPQCQRM